MRLDEWRGLLRVDDGKSRDRDDFWALCPCHNDHDASLHVYISSDRQIVMKCHACGADRKDVAEALGYALRDVLVDPYTGEPTGKNALPPAPAADAPKKQPKRVRPYQEGAEWKFARKGEMVPFRVVRVYEYKDAEGHTVLLKARLERYGADGQRIEKSFAVQSTPDGGKTWYTNDGGYGQLLYHADELAAAVRERRRVILCEGEKDADNLRALGYTATTAQHGAGSGRHMQGKWAESQTQALLGAQDVVLFPDNDEPGRAFMAYVAEQLHAAGQLCRVVDIASLWQDAPKKADFTDWARYLQSNGQGRRAIIERLEHVLTHTPDYDPDGLKIFTVTSSVTADAVPPSPEGKAGGEAALASPAGGGAPAGGGEGKEDKDWEDYHGLKAYGIKWGKLCAIGKGGANIIADFVPTLTETILRDDGQETSMEFTVAATTGEGERLRKLKDARILGVSKMKGMDWPVENWGAYGRIAPGARTAGQVYDAILRAGQKTSVWRTIYGHTGIAMIDGKACYLYNGGAVGAEGVSVELRNNLRYYDLSAGDISAADGAAASWQLAGQVEDRIILPLLAQAYLAPVYSVLEGMDMPPSYVVYVAGQTGAFKSSLVSYVMAHFGRFYNRRFPATFEDTANSARDKTFIVKDALYVVDDYNPQNDRRAMTRMDGVANAVITSIADRAERGGLTASKELRDERPSRCTCIITGEQLPNLGQGRVLRLYIINVAEGEIAKDTEALRPFADRALKGYYRAAMRGYIERLLARWDGIKDEMAQRMDACQRVTDELLDKKWARMNHAAACLLLGCDLMLEHMQAMGVVPPGGEERQRQMMRCWRAIEQNITAQKEAIEEATPGRMWLSALQSLMRTRQVATADLLDKDAIDRYMQGKIGWRDGECYYLEPEAADRAVRQLWKDTGTDIGASPKQIRRQLVELGFVLPGQGRDGKLTPTRPKTVGGHTVRVLVLPRALVDGEEAFEEVEGDAPAAWAEQTTL